MKRVVSSTKAKYGNGVYNSVRNHQAQRYELSII